MQSNFQIGIIGSYFGHTIDINLPIINENDLSEAFNNCGCCFYINDLSCTELYLFSKNAEGVKRTAKLNIREACKPNSNLSLLIIKMNDGSFCLRTYVDSKYNGLFKLPEILTG